MEQVICVYLAAVNLMGLTVMGVDKQKAKKRRWRISEKALFLTALAGGSLGIWGGMYLFRHKTRHLRFVIGVPAIFAVQMIGMYLWFWR